MNTRLLRRVARYIAKEPRKFDMRLWCKSSDYAPCGTVACIAGWTAILHKKWENKLTDELRSQLQWDLAESVAISALQLTHDQANRLFLPFDDCDPSWPKRFWTAYESAKTPKQRVKVALARIEHFIKTKGAE